MKDVFGIIVVLVAVLGLMFSILLYNQMENNLVEFKIEKGYEECVKIVGGGTTTVWKKTCNPKGLN